jgi:hypothetical protein
MAWSEGIVRLAGAVVAKLDSYRQSFSSRGPVREPKDEAPISARIHDADAVWVQSAGAPILVRESILSAH